MKKILILTMVFLGMVGFVYCQGSERLTDKETKELIEKIEDNREDFEDALDDNLKNALYRSSRGEVNIKEYLDDFQQKVEKLKERFTKEYSASSEAAAVLDQASGIDAFIASHPGTKGASEWERFAVDLRALAAAYGTSFPLPSGGPVRRINDAEAAQSADLFAKQADQLKKEIGKDKNLPKEVKESYKNDIEALKKEAKILKSRIEDSKPATTEARSLIDHARAVGESLQQTQMSSGISSAWNAMASALQKLETAFGIGGQ